MAKGGRITREIAENLAIQALSFLAADPERLGRFLAITGIGPDAIRKAAVDPASRSPLAFTGSTALSMLGASLLLMLVGVAALFASRRRYRHRH